MLINFKNVSDEEVTYELLSEGNYVLKVDKCESKMSQKGTLYWSIVYVDKDNNKVFDSLYFTEKTLNRVKKCFKVLGLDVDGEFDYDPEDIVGCYMNASVIVEDYQDRNGKDKQRNAIDLWACEPYKVSKKAAPKKQVEESEEEIPF